MKKLTFSLILMILMIPSWASADEPILDKETKAVANRVILNIYYDLLEAKEDHKELEQFDETSLFENKQGIYAVVYKYEKSKEQMEKDPFEFAITITTQDDEIFQEYGGYAFNFEFPILGLKFAGYSKRAAGRKKYDIFKTINRFGRLLADHQQKYMPLRLILKTRYPVYTVNEPVSFTVELKNAGHKNVWVVDLNDRSLYCLFDGKLWGTQQLDYEEQGGILYSGNSISQIFTGQAFKEPQQFEIYCTYNMSIKGVQPSGTLKITVVEENEKPQD